VVLEEHEQPLPEVAIELFERLDLLQQRLPVGL
jgi:hypothetical protein